MPSEPLENPGAPRTRRSHRADAPAMRAFPRPVRYALGAGALVVLLSGSLAFASTTAPGGLFGTDAAPDLAGDGAQLTGRDEMWAQASRGDGRDPLLLEVDPVTFTVSVDGQDVELTSGAATLADALIEAGIEIGLEDEVSAPMGETPTDGEHVTIVRVGTQHGTDVEDIPFETVERETSSLPRGTTEVQDEGAEGTRVTTYLAEYTDGEEVSRSDQLTVVVQQPENRVVLVGTAAPVVAAPSTGSGSSGSSESGSSGSGSSGSSEPAAPVQTYSGGDSRGIAQQMVAARGWGADQWSCLDQLWQKESNWNHTAQNPTSSAYGIPQSLPGSKMASAGSDWRTNPATQIEWGLGYIAGRYGNPCGAWAHSQARNWY